MDILPAFENLCPPVVANADDLYALTLSLLLGNGNRVLAGESLSTGAKQETLEHLNYQVRLNCPHDKLVQNLVVLQK
jgi:hypothetical protein